MRARCGYVAALLLTMTSHAQTEPAVEKPTPPPRAINSTTLELAPREELNDETWALMREVSIQGTVRKDLFFQAAKAVLSGTFKGDVWGAVAGPFTFTGQAEDDLRVFASGPAQVNGRIDGNLLLLAESVQTETNTVVAGASSISAGAMVLDGVFEGLLEATASGAVTLKGEVKGDVKVTAGEITLMPGAVIRGDLSYDAPEPPMLSPGARVEGEIRQQSQPSIPYTAILAMLLFISHSGFGLMALALLPRFFAGALTVLAHTRMGSLFNGGVAAVVLMFLAALFFSSSLAAVLGIVCVAVLVVADACGLTVVALTLAGLLLPPRVTARPAGRALALVLGMAVIHLALLVPGAGPFLLLAAHLAGIGAVVVYTVGTQRIRRMNPPPIPPPAVPAA